MKNWFSHLLIVLFFAVGCSKNSSPVESVDEGSLRISGKISDFNGHFDKAYISLPPRSGTPSYFESAIKADGSFDITIAPPSEEQLIKHIPRSRVFVTNGDSSIAIDSVKIDAQNFKYLRYRITAVSTPSITYALPLDMAQISTIGEPVEIGDYFISYYYFNTKTKIHGYYKWIFTAANKSKEITTNFDINTKSGWNKVITKFDYRASDKEIYTIQEVDEGTGSWIIGASDYFPNTAHRF